MEKNDMLELIDGQIAMLDVLAVAVANGSPSAIEGHRASLLAQRRELDPPEESDEDVLDAEEANAALADRPDPYAGIHEPGEELAKSDAAAVEANPRVADAEGPDAAEVDEPGDQLVASDHAAEAANPHGVDSRGNVGDGRKELSDEQKADQVAAIKSPEDNEPAAPAVPEAHVEAPVVVDAPEESEQA